MFKLNDKIAVVTGAGSGIGEMIAHTFAEAGAYVYVADKNPEGGQAVVEKIHAADGQAEFAEVDVASEASCQALGHHVSGQKQRCDILVNNAGYRSCGHGFDDDCRRFRE